MTDSAFHIQNFLHCWINRWWIQVQKLYLKLTILDTPNEFQFHVILSEISESSLFNGYKNYIFVLILHRFYKIMWDKGIKHSNMCKCWCTDVVTWQKYQTGCSKTQQNAGAQNVLSPVKEWKIWFCHVEADRSSRMQCMNLCLFREWNWKLAC